MSNENGDLEAPLNPSTQDPELKWSFVRKVYLIVTLQFVVTFAIAAAVAFVQPIFNFFSNPWNGWGFFVLALIVLIIVVLMLVFAQNEYPRHPRNFLLLGIGTLCIGLFLGLATTFISGVVIVEAGITIIAVVLSLLAYTFLASWRGQDFGFFIPLLLSVTVTVVLYIIYQIYFPMGSITSIICSGLVVLMISAPIVNSTDSLFSEFGDLYILASATLYLGVISIFSISIQSIIGCWGSWRRL